MQQQGRKLNKHKAVVLLTCAVMAWLIWSILSALFYMIQADREATRTFNQLAQTTQQTLQAQKTLEYHATGAYVEKVAREDMLMSKKNDTVILFPVDHAGSQTTQASTNQLHIPPVLERLIAWVKGWF